MRITSMLILLTSFQAAWANGYSQTVTLSVKNAPATKVFEEIKKQTGYYFFYNSSQEKSFKPITVTVSNVTLEDALERIFNDQPFSYTIVSQVIVIKEKQSTAKPISTGMQSQPFIDISGRVINENKEPLAGVTIKIKETNISTTTNRNGEFSLKSVENDAVLVFTHVGMEPFELNVNGRAVLEISLQTKVTELSNVVVSVSTGYEEIPRERAAGSFERVDNKTLNQQVGTNILKRLEGVTSSLLFNVDKNNNNPQNSTGITIRGLSTINGPLDPLIVLNGFIYEGDINNINPNDIESVTVLKDANAASIWGARAGNGVIVINTKKGKYNQKLEVSLNSNVIIGEKPDLFYLRQMKSADYIDVEQTLFNNGFFDNTISQPYTPLTPAVDIFLQKRNGLISAADSAAQINALKMVDSRNDFNKYVYRRSVTQQHSIGITGGGNNNTYALSVGYDDLRGELRNESRKLNIRLDNTFRPIKALQINLGVYYTNSRSKSGLAPYGATRLAERAPNYYRLADDAGNALPLAVRYRRSFIDTAGEGKLLNWQNYPLLDYLHDRTTNNQDEIYATIGLQYKILRSLSVSVGYQYQKQRTNSERLSDQESFNSRDLINLYSQLDRSTGVVKYIVPLGGIRSMGEATSQSQTFRGQLNFDHSWKRHSLTALAGAEVREARGYGNSFTAYGYFGDPLSVTSVDFLNPYPTITGGYSNIGGAPSFTSTTYRFVSLYGNASYVYNNRYILTGSLRRDGSNIFGVKTNDRWKPLWSVGAAWNISQEPFYRSSMLPYLKMRVTYGYSGNLDLSKSGLPILYYNNNSFPSNLPYATVTNINNPELRWEQIGQLNFGFDFSLKNDIVSGSVEYYRKYGKDLYGETPYDYTAWGPTSNIIRNVGNIKGQGIDIDVNANIVDRAFKWRTALLFNYNTAKTTKYYNLQAQLLSTLLGGGKSITPVVGRPPYGIAAFRWGGLDADGNPQGYLNGELSTDYNAIRQEINAKGIESQGVVFIGTGSPVYFGSIVNTFSFKQLSLTVNISYKLGYYFFKPTISYSNLTQFGVGHSDYALRWQQPGDESNTNVPSFTFPSQVFRDYFYQQSEINVLRGDQLRLQYINLDYSFRGSNNKKPPFDNIQLYANVGNVGILWRANDAGLDPDYPAALRPVRTWALGLRAKF